MTQDELKQSVACEAIKHVVEDAVVGVGTGSTANFFIDELAKMKNRITGAVASSDRSAERLKGHGIRLFDLNSVNELPVYIDGADEITEHLAMIKGGGGALTREKIVAAAAKKFVCIADGSKLVPVLGKFPLPVEVIPMARAYVARQMVKLGREAEGLDRPTYPGELGKRIFENVSKEAWAAWLKHQTMLVNENRLNLADAKARKYLQEQMEKHFFGDGADVASGYVPPKP